MQLVGWTQCQLTLGFVGWLRGKGRQQARLHAFVGGAQLNEQVVGIRIDEQVGLLPE